MYGETGRLSAEPVVLCGLSPRVRGNLRGRADKPASTGSIPACTGKPVAGGRLCRRREVYPRVYGETIPGLSLSVSLLGLSPRVRGNPGRPYHASPRVRSIPACTGKPVSVVVSVSVEAVYPRVYGETSHRPPSSGGFDGLSPRVRGNQKPKPRRGASYRSIPACTGKPAFSASLSAFISVYPRVYGETTDWTWTGYRTTGLSPRVRGNPFNLVHLVFHVRSIPACTGKPGTAAPPARRRGVYPRVYGETA